MVSFHVEPTSKCTLQCSLCDRTWFYEKFKRRLIHEIDIEDIVKFIGSNAEVSLCGNNGDPIYHSKFIKLCKKLKENNCKIKITTNGSGRSINWWKKLNLVLNKEDILRFSIDGLEDTNHIYRKNAKWKSIMTAIKTFEKRKCKLYWKFIVFKHNEHQIVKANNLCKKLNFDFFELEKSDRWLGQKNLIPSEKFVDSYYLQQKRIMVDRNFTVEMSPYCLKNSKPSKNLYIDAEGNFYPCCWIGTYVYRYNNIFSPKYNKFNIKNNTLEKILKNKKVENFFQSTKDFESAHECCKIQCGVKNG